MSVDGVRDEFLARRAGDGDGVAFGELVRRYEPLIAAACRRPPDGLGVEDARQAALLGLYEACRETDGLRRFAGMARLRVRWAVAAAFRSACTGKQRILSDAARDGDEPDGALARLAGPTGLEPALVVELRSELRERWEAHQRRTWDRARAPRGDLRRRYSDEQIARAVAMVAAGSTVAAAVEAVGAGYGAVRNWVSQPRDGKPAALVTRRSRMPDHGLHRGYSDEQIARVRALVDDGHSIRSAAADIGAAHSTVLRWLREAA
jgi:transposase-like protein